MNYNHANWVYKKYGLEDKMADDFFEKTVQKLSIELKDLEIVY
jgi:transcriptional regulatory protein LevR